MTVVDSSQSAHSIIDTALSQYGLQSLSTWAWEQYLAGTPIDTIMFQMRQRPEYKLRFPAMDSLAAGGHAISENEYIGYEHAVTGIMRQYGLPAGFYDQPDDFTKLLSGQVSVSEVSQRLAAYSDVVNAQDPQVLREFQDLYGITPGQLTAYAIDPDRATPLLLRQFQASQTAAQAYDSGYGQLTQTEAERYAGANPAGFSKLAGLSEVLNPLPGETGGIDRATGLSAEFDQNAAAQAQIAAAQAKRVAAFSQGGQFAGSQQGLVGTGTAQ